MRIISGKYKSRRIHVSPALKARPTTDFAKEGLFDVLNNLLDWGRNHGARPFFGNREYCTGNGVARMSAGSECRDEPKLLRFYCQNKKTLGAIELFPICADVFKFVASCKEKYDLIFADPPYDLPTVDTIPTLIIENKLLKPHGIFIMEHSDKHHFSHLPFFKEERKYGRVRFSIFENK